MYYHMKFEPTGVLLPPSNVDELSTGFIEDKANKNGRFPARISLVLEY